MQRGGGRITLGRLQPERAGKTRKCSHGCEGQAVFQKGQKSPGKRLRHPVTERGFVKQRRG